MFKLAINPELWSHLTVLHNNGCNHLGETIIAAVFLWYNVQGFSADVLPAESTSQQLWDLCLLKHLLYVVKLALQKFPPGCQVTVGQNTTRLQEAEGVVLDKVKLVGVPGFLWEGVCVVKNAIEGAVRQCGHYLFPEACTKQQEWVDQWLGDWFIQCVKLIRNYIRDPSGLFSICSLVRIIVGVISRFYVVEHGKRTYL